MNLWWLLFRPRTSSPVAVPAPLETLHLQIFLNDDLTSPRLLKSISLPEGSGIYGTGVYGMATYGTPATLSTRIRMALTGKKWRARLRSISASKTLSIYKVGMQSVPLSSRS